MNQVKEVLQGGGTAIGTTAGPENEVRFLAGAGFDFLLFDTQHTTVELKQLGPVLSKMRGRQASPVVRVADNRPDQICFALDAGARGLVAPMINTHRMRSKWSVGADIHLPVSGARLVSRVNGVNLMTTEGIWKRLMNSS